jgi:hypothetical protein
MRFKVVRICGSEANTVLPEEPVVFELERTASILRGMGYMVSIRDAMLVAVKDTVEISLYRTGRMVIHPLEREKAREIAEMLFRKLTVTE